MSKLLTVLMAGVFATASTFALAETAGEKMVAADNHEMKVDAKADSKEDKAQAKADKVAAKTQAKADKKAAIAQAKADKVKANQEEKKADAAADAAAVR
jgi:hypothetical protein